MLATQQNSLAVSIALWVILGITALITVRKLHALLKEKIKEAKKKSNKQTFDSVAFQVMADRLTLTKDEKVFLEQLCKKSTVTDLPLIAETDYCITTIFKTLYQNLCKNKEKLSATELENKKFFFFMIIHKIEEVKKTFSLLTSTTAFSEDLPISYITDDKIHHTSKIVENNSTGLYLALDKIHISSSPPLSKIILYLELRGGIAYQATTRIIRYQTREDRDEVVVAHTQSVKFFQRRKFRRKDVFLNCTFYAAKVNEDSKTKKISYTPQGKEYRGIITDISASGCRLSTILPIREGQYMQIMVSLSPEETDTMTSVIVRSKRVPNKNLCILNMRFVRMSKKTQNNIFARVYDYDSEAEQSDN